MAKPKKKPERGGSRPGAGRPPLHGERMVTIAVSLPREVVERIDAEAAKEGVSRAEAVRRRLAAG